MSIKAPSTVLIVDDDAAAVDALARIIRTRCKTVLSAGTLAVARKLLTEPIDMILLDLMLPDGSGVELLKDLQAMQSPSRVVVMSGMDDAPFAVAPYRGQVDAVLPKPIVLTTLFYLLGL